MTFLSSSSLEMFILLNENLPEIVIKVVVVQLLSCIWLFATPYTTVHQASLYFIITQSFLKLISTESSADIQQFYPLVPSSILPSVFTNIKDFSNSQFFKSHGQSISFSWYIFIFIFIYIFPSKKYPGLISFSNDWFHLFVVHGTLSSLLQHHNLKASIL